MILLFGAISTWLTPFWLLAAGVFAAMVVLGLAYGVIRMLSRRATMAVDSSLREGFLLPVLVLGGILSVFAIGVAFVVPFEPLMRSTGRLASVAAAKVLYAVGIPQTAEALLAPVDRTIDVAADAKDMEVDLDVVPAEVSLLEVTADKNMYFTVELPGATQTYGETRISLLPNEKFQWDRESNQKYLFYGDTTRLFLTNNSALPATVSIHVETRPEHPEAAAIPWTAAWFIGLVVGFLLLRAAMPRIMAVATTTSKEALAQPIFQIVLALGVAFLTITVFIPYNTFGDDVSMLKDTNLSFLMLLSIFIALWTASVGLADEIEGRTALTVLSKPIGRPQFLLGKFAGVLLPVLLMFLFLGTLFLLTVSFKVVYDARETAHPEPIWQRCYVEMIGIIPGLALAFMETIVMAAIAVAIATRLPMLANLSICFTIYIVGHLLPLLVMSKKVSDPYGIIQFMGQLFAVVLPVLEHFNIYAAIAGGAVVPWEYLFAALGYCVLYSCLAMLFALFLFEDRDLA
jgi:ABC-type transport system involved in multi-copper enzyme maturation permease subunit